MPGPQFKLILFYLSYLYFGAMFFYLVESKHERNVDQMIFRERLELTKTLNMYLAPDYPQLRKKILANISHYCGKPMHSPLEDGFNYQSWTFYHCLFFALTIVTTVGYGNILPRTVIGKQFTIFYAIVGLPLNGVLFAKFGQFYWEIFDRAHDAFHNYAHKIRLMLALRWLIFLIPGFVVFIMLPAYVFTFVEKWNYGNSMYYAFVTLTTIGFGDYAATFESQSAVEINEWYYVYQAFVLIWFILGLGYLVMIMQYMMDHYEKSTFNQLDFEKPMQVKSEVLRFSDGFKKDLKSLCGLFHRTCCCGSRCCKCGKPPKVISSTDIEPRNTKDVIKNKSGTLNGPKPKKVDPLKDGKADKTDDKNIGKKALPENDIKLVAKASQSDKSTGNEKIQKKVPDQALKNPRAKRSRSSPTLRVTALNGDKEEVKPL